ncbi:hypothetical protein RDV64_17700 [Acuticoccus sp. MNP-M23]|uniref:hypothetical protein n=1 Tax=Acuticoccus sp. MNP-M23 TaxID=3072793 RepID=UPI002814CC89|nr:hypothetical protein [Acuticoccus sp. MNP-M23]WMS41884.1 hypothetical protein RDV64_17700 [Acuticoccus sp. MNP-M23]
MSMIFAHSRAPRRRFPGLARVLKIWIASGRGRLRVRREMAALSDIPDHLLRDLGIEEHSERRKRPVPPTWR